MGPQQYYEHVFDRLQRSFDGFHYVVAAGQELLAHGWDPALLVAVEPVDQLGKFTLERGMQVHMPVVGERSRTVLMPMDLEVFLLGENHLLYTDRRSHRHWFEQFLPVCRFVEDLLQSRGIPYLLDYTPSGAHLLWRNPIGEPAAKAIGAIGYLEEDLIAACRYVDPNDIKRWWGISLDAARVFSGLGRLAEYIALLAIQSLGEGRGAELPLTIADSVDRCINFDNSWAEGSPFMRSIRSPFSLHKKNQQKHNMAHMPPLVDVIGAYFDGETVVEERSVDRITECMWDLSEAAKHAQQFTGVIPNANANMVDLVAEYRRSALYELHREIDRTDDLPRQQARARAERDGNLTDHVRRVLAQPNPLALQPKNMLGLVYDLLIYADWRPKHIGNLLRDLYIDPRYGWTIDFFKYPAEEKASFWARTFSALVLHRTGRIRV